MYGQARARACALSVRVVTVLVLYTNNDTVIVWPGQGEGVCVLEYGSLFVVPSLVTQPSPFSSHPLSFYMENTSVPRKVCRRMECGLLFVVPSLVTQPMPACSGVSSERLGC